MEGKVGKVPRTLQRGESTTVEKFAPLNMSLEKIVSETGE